MQTICVTNLIKNTTVTIKAETEAELEHQLRSLFPGILQSVPVGDLHDSVDKLNGIDYLHVYTPNLG